jgi:hypothetical protein
MLCNAESSRNMFAILPGLKLRGPVVCLSSAKLLGNFFSHLKCRNYQEIFIFIAKVKEKKNNNK